MYKIQSLAHDSFFCLWISSRPSNSYWKGQPSSTELFLFLCQKLMGHVCVDLLLDFLFCLIDLYLSLCQHHSVLIIVAIQQVLTLGEQFSLYLLQLCPGYLDCFPFHINFSACLPISSKLLARILIEIVLSLHIKMGRIAFCMMLSLPILGHCVFHEALRSLVSVISIL